MALFIRTGEEWKEIGEEKGWHAAKDMNWGHCREDTASVHGPYALAGHPSITDFDSNNMNYYMYIILNICDIQLWTVKVIYKRASDSENLSVQFQSFSKISDVKVKFLQKKEISQLQTSVSFIGCHFATLIYINNRKYLYS